METNNEIAMVKPTIPINNKLYYSLEDAAKALGMSESTLRRRINRKDIRYLAHVKGPVFLPEWLDEYLWRITKEPRKIKRF